MGEMTDGGLYEIFQQDYGPVGSPSFEQARNNFLVSSAGYAVASLLLQPKDRHNGNLLFDRYFLIHLLLFVPLHHVIFNLQIVKAFSKCLVQEMEGDWSTCELVCISEGRLVHIDFGFILETSPGGNMRFESAQFKLSHEMTQLLDPSGIMKSDIWNCFVRSAHSSLCLTFLSAIVKQHGPSLQLIFLITIALVCISIYILSLGPYKR